MSTSSLPDSLRIPAQCWLVVGNAQALAPADAALERLFSWLCTSAPVVTAAEFAVQPVARRWPRVALAVISGTCGDEWQPRILSGGGPTLPLLVLAARGAWSALGLAEHSSWLGGTAALRLADEAHAVAAGFRRGHVPVYEGGSVRVLTSNPCAGAAVIAHVPSPLAPTGRLEHQYSVIAAYEAESGVCGGARAAARRVSAGFDSVAHESTHATRILAAAGLWLSGASSSQCELVLARLEAWTTEMADSAETTRAIEEYARMREDAATRAIRAAQPRSDDDEIRAAFPPNALGCHPMAPTACAMPPLAPADATVLVHTFAGYRRFWPGFAAHFAARWAHSSFCWPLSFASDEGDVSEAIDALRGCGIAAHPAPTGGGGFSTRLTRALAALTSPLVFYLQEDVWLTGGGDSESVPAVLSCASELVRRGSFDGIRFEPPAAVLAGWYHLEETNVTCAGRAVLRFAPRNRWLYSHQPGLWRVDALLSGGREAVMQPDENPWLNELLGSRRAAGRGLVVGLVVLDWFASVSSSGALNDVGHAMVMTAGAAAEA